VSTRSRSSGPPLATHKRRSAEAARGPRAPGPCRAPAHDRFAEVPDSALRASTAPPTSDRRWVAAIALHAGCSGVSGIDDAVFPPPCGRPRAARAGAMAEGTRADTNQTRCALAGMKREQGRSGPVWRREGAARALRSTAISIASVAAAVNPARSRQIEGPRLSPAQNGPEWRSGRKRGPRFDIRGGSAAWQSV